MSQPITSGVIVTFMNVLENGGTFGRHCNEICLAFMMKAIEEVVE